MMNYQKLTEALHGPINMMSQKIDSVVPLAAQAYGGAVSQAASKIVQQYGAKALGWAANSMTPVKSAFASYADLTLEDYCGNQVGRFIKEQDYISLIKGTDGDFLRRGKDEITSELNLIGQKAECLNQQFGHLTPGQNYADSLATFSDHTQSIMMDNYETLKEVAPNLVNTVTVPDHMGGLTSYAVDGLREGVNSAMPYMSLAIDSSQDKASGLGLEAQLGMAVVMGGSIVVMKYAPNVYAKIKTVSGGAKSLFKKMGRKIT